MRNLLDFLVELVVGWLPHDSISARVKRALLRARGAKVGRGVKIWRNVWIDRPAHLEIGADVTLGRSVIILTEGGVTIGARAMIGHGAQIVSAGHRIPLDPHEPMRFSGVDASPIRIAEDAWVGAGAIILGGVVVGRGAVVAAGAVAAKDVPDHAIVAGVPARVVKSRLRSSE